MKHFFYTISESINKKIFKSTSILLFTNVVVGIAALLTISIIAKNLTIEEFGSLAIIQAYAMTINGLFNFQTWQTVVKYYPDTDNDTILLCSLLKYSFIIDIVTAITSFLFAGFGIFFIAELIQLKTEYIHPALMYVLIILFTIEGTATGYLRIIDKFYCFFITDGITTVAKLITIFYVSKYYGTIESFVLTFVIFAFIKTLLINIFFVKYIGWSLVRKTCLASINDIKQKFQDIWEFSLYTSLTGSFDIVFKQADTLVVSTFFGVYYAGIYKMLKTFGNLLLQCINPIYLSLFPVVSERKHQTKELFSFINKSIGYLFCLGIIGTCIFYWVHTFFINILFGTDYLEYAPYLMLYIVPIIISGIFTAVHSSFNLLGFHKTTLYLIVTTSIFYILMIYILKDYMGFISVLFMLIVHSLIIVSFKYTKLFIFCRNLHAYH